jgi:hypothetical protein
MLGELDTFTLLLNYVSVRAGCELSAELEFFVCRSVGRRVHFGQPATGITRARGIP